MLLLFAAFLFARMPLSAQTKPAQAGASTTVPAQGQVQPSPPPQGQSASTTVPANPKTSVPAKTYSIRVRASVVGIGKDSADSSALSQQSTRQQGSGSAPAAVQSAPSLSASLPDSPEAKGGFVEALDRKAKWGVEQIKYASPGTPIQVKLIGANIVSLIQLIPFENGPNSLDVVASGQVWVMMPDGGIKYRTTVSTLSVTLAERMFFFPLGYGPDGSAPLVVEIIVDRLAK